MHAFERVTLKMIWTEFECKFTLVGHTVVNHKIMLFWPIVSFFKKIHTTFTVWRQVKLSDRIIHRHCSLALWCHFRWCASQATTRHGALLRLK